MTIAGQAARAAVLVLSIASPLAAEEPGVAPAPFACAVPLISVTAASPEQARSACDAAEAADSRFAALGLANGTPIRIEVTEALKVGPGQCVALFDVDASVVEVLPAHCLVGNPGRLAPFPQLPGEVLFDSLVVHELAHAYAHWTAGEVRLSRVAHEYIAYAVQLDALPAPARLSILEAAGIAAPVEIGSFDEALLNFRPQTFAAMAWLHFTENGGDAAAIRPILAGDVTFYSLRE